MVDFPFTAKDFFKDRDIALINGEVEGEVIDNNFFSALSASGAPGNLIQSDKLKWRTNDYGDAPAGSFNANGILSDIEMILFSGITMRALSVIFGVSEKLKLAPNEFLTKSSIWVIFSRLFIKSSTFTLSLTSTSYF